MASAADLAGIDVFDSLEEPDLESIAPWFSDETAAEGCFRQAIELARHQQSRAWELRAAMSLARLWQRQGRRSEARNALEAVYGAYTEGFTTPDLVDANSLLASLTESSAVANGG